MQGCPVCPAKAGTACAGRGEASNAAAMPPSTSVTGRAQSIAVEAGLAASGPVGPASKASGLGTGFMIDSLGKCGHAADLAAMVRDVCAA